MRGDRVHVLVLLCFLLSGFAALIYQTTWAREFALVFGASELAVATVLAAYMGGLAGGAAAGGWLARRIRRPVLAYALLEAGIAASALAVPRAIRGATGLYVALFGGEAELATAGGTRTALFFLAASLAILLVPTGLMGATLPLLARHAVRPGSPLGRRIGLLYATNTVGAVAGAVVSAFVLLPRLGLRGTIYFAVATSFAVFLLATAVAFATRRLDAAEAVPEEPALPAAFGWILPAVLVSGIVSFSYEILWTRLLTHVLAGGVYAFATMLASFLTGIAIGSAVAARSATDRVRAARGFALAQLATAALSGAAYLGIDWLPALSVRLQLAGGRSLADPVVSVLTLLPSTLCIGATFPFAVRILARDHRDASSATARVYAWNTVGAIVGSVGAGFWVIPALGFGASLRLAVGTNVALALVAALCVSPRAVRLAQASAVALIALAFFRPGEPWTLLRTGPLSPLPEPGEVIFHKVGRTATVVVIDQGAEWRLRTNGLPESSIQRTSGRSARHSSDRWLSLLPVLARPHSTERLLLVGLGGGTVVEEVPPAVRAIDVVELEPEVVDANRAMGPDRLFDPLADPRVTLRVNDARAALLLSTRKFDAIASQPSHPWTAGASHLYTREFFRLVHDRLTPGGTFALWMGAGFVDAPLLRGIVATLLDTFPYVRMYSPIEPGNFLFLASDQPLPVQETAAEAIAAAPELFRSTRIASMEDVESALLLDEAGARAFAEGATIFTDDRNLLQMRSPQIIGHGLSPADFGPILAPHDPLPAPLPGMDPLRLVRGLLEHGMIARADRVAHATHDPAKRHAAQGLVAGYYARTDVAGRELDQALALDPTSEAVRALVLQLRRSAIERQGASAVPALQPLRPNERLLIDGWRKAAGEPAALAALEPALADVPIGDALWPQTQRLRSRIRLAEGSPTSAREGLKLLDDAMALDPGPDDFLLRSRLLVAAGEPVQALDALLELGPVLTQPGPWRPFVEDALVLLDQIPADRGGDSIRTALRQLFSAVLAGKLQQPPRVAPP